MAAGSIGAWRGSGGGPAGRVGRAGTAVGWGGGATGSTTGMSSATKTFVHAGQRTDLPRTSRGTRNLRLQWTHQISANMRQILRAPGRDVETPGRPVGPPGVVPL